MTASVYANSLFSLCEEENCEEMVLSDLKEAVKLFNENEGYDKLLSTPTVELKERLSLIDEAFGSFHVYVLNLIKVLCEKRSAGLLVECAENFEKLYNKKNGIEKITVITAVKLSEKLSEKLYNKLSENGNKKIILEEKVDKTILGGIVVRTENSQTDASVRKRLETIKTQLVSSGNID